MSTSMMNTIMRSMRAMTTMTSMTTSMNMSMADITSLTTGIPTIITITDEKTNVAARIECGAAILNVAAAEKTPELVRRIRGKLPEIPIIATGGNKPDTILATIEAGANAITYTPPSTQEMFKIMMSKYREN